MDLKQKIKSKGFTITEVGQKMNPPLTQQSMSSLVSSNANPTISKLREVARVIGVPLSELVADENDRTTNSAHSTAGEGHEVSDLIAMIRYKDQSYYLTSVESLRQFLATIDKSKEFNM